MKNLTQSLTIYKNPSQRMPRVNELWFHEYGSRWFILTKFEDNKGYSTEFEFRRLVHNVTTSERTLRGTTAANRPWVIGRIKNLDQMFYLLNKDKIHEAFLKASSKVY